MVSGSGSATHRTPSAPVRSCWGTTPSCRWASLPTSPPPPAASPRWRRPWRRTARPRWSAGRGSAPSPAAGHTHCPPTCPEEREPETWMRGEQRSPRGLMAPSPWWLTRLRYWGSSSLEERPWVFRESNDLILEPEECGTPPPSPETPTPASQQLWLVFYITSQTTNVKKVQNLTFSSFVESNQGVEHLGEVQPLQQVTDLKRLQEKCRQTIKGMTETATYLTDDELQKKKNKLVGLTSGYDRKFW